MTIERYSHIMHITSQVSGELADGKGLIAIDKISGPMDRVPKWIAPDAVRFLAEDEKFSYLQRNDNVIVALDKATGEGMKDAGKEIKKAGK